MTARTTLPGLAATGVTVHRGSSRGHRVILDDVSLSCAAGTVTAIVGPSGAGKSTLLAALAGDLPLTAGLVTLAGRPLAAMPLTGRAAIRAVLPQHTELRLAYTALEVVRMGLGLTPAPSLPSDPVQTTDSQVLEALALAEARHLAHRLYPRLSGGEQQRVQLARVFAQLIAAAPAPGLLLLDEPASALDIGLHARVMAAVRSFAARNIAVVFVTHDLNMAAATADTVAVLNKGRLIACGGPAAALSVETVRVAFGADVHVYPHPETGTPWITPRMAPASHSASANH